MRYADILAEDAGSLYYHGTNKQFEAFEPAPGSLGAGVYLTAFRSIAYDYAKRRVANSGGEPIVVPVRVRGAILWNGSKAHAEVLEAASSIVRRNERMGKIVKSNDAVRAVCEARGYVGWGAPDTICIFDSANIEIVPEAKTNAT